MKRYENLTDEEIEKAFANTNFGTRDHRALVEQGLLKWSVGYVTGGTLERILMDLRLLTVKHRLTARGRWVLFHAFYTESNQG